MLPHAKMQSSSALGSWVDRVDEVIFVSACDRFYVSCFVQLAASFHTAHPYPHVAIPEFFSPEFAAELSKQFPCPMTSKSGWFLYNNPIEIKFANNDRSSLPACFNAAIDILNSDHTRRLVSAISGVPFLEEVVALTSFHF
jgi:hypothetical protein